MRALVLTTGAGPAEGLLVLNATAAGHEVDVLDVAGHAWLRRTRRGLPRLFPWTGTWALREAGSQIARRMRAIIEAGAYDMVLTSGLGAGAFASRHVEEEFVPLLWRGDLDFSAVREHATQDLARLTTAVDRLFLDDEWEFDKALSKGSRSAHLRHLPPAVPATALAPLESAAVPPRVVVLHPERRDDERLENQLAAFASVIAEVPGASLRPLSASALYRRRDMERNRAFDAVARARLDGATHVVLVGSSRDHAAAGDLLLGTGFGGRLLVEDTIGMGAWAESRGGVRSGRGLRLVTELSALIDAPDGGGSAPEPGDVPVRHADVLTAYRAAMTGRVDRDFEDLAALRHDGPLDVFFSTSPLEDRTDGARPQRVRNMADALDVGGAAVRMSSVPGVFDRRVRVVRSAIADGRPLGLFYGENSTSPIPVPRVTLELAGVMREFSRAGGDSVWFVRDLHWLDDIEGYLQDVDARRDMRERGLAELETIAAAADRVAAPSVESGRGFDALLARYGRAGYDWVPLPPAVAPANTVPSGLRLSGDEGLTLLYAGGVSGIYGLDQYLDAAARLDDTIRLDFVVREGERATIDGLLADHGLAGRPGVRVSTVPLEWYVPATSDVVGVVLLGGEYARFSFPYKTMSLIERGYPVLCFADMGIAAFLEENRVGLGVERDADAIRAGLERLAVHGAPGMAEAQRSQTWGARLDAARAAARH